MCFPSFLVVMTRTGSHYAEYDLLSAQFNYLAVVIENPTGHQIFTNYLGYCPGAGYR